MGSRILIIGSWLALAITLGVMGFTMLRACGLRLPDGTVVLEWCGPDPVPSAFAAERQRAEALERRLVQLQQEVAEVAWCALPPEPEPEPEPQSEPPEAPEEEEQRADRPFDCPPQRPTEVMVVLDVSPSMGWDFDLDPDQEARIDGLFDEANHLIRRQGELQASTGNLANLARMPAVLGELSQIDSRLRTLEAEIRRASQDLRNSPGVDRIDIAKRAIEGLVTEMPDDVVISALSFAECGRPRYHGEFAPARRSDLLGTVRGLRLRQSTALAEAISQAPRHIAGGRTPDAPINIVLFSDGADSCGGDPCAQARALKAAYPYAYINVIGIGRSLDVQQCIADATGGRFLNPRDADELGSLMQLAAGQEISPECRQ